MLHHKLSVQSSFHAYAVVYLDRQGREVSRGIFSEERPTLLTSKGAVRTRCVAKSTSRRNYGRAEEILKSKLGSGWR